MSLFRIYVDGSLFYHPNLSKLAVSQAKMTEDAENIDSFHLVSPAQSSVSILHSSDGIYYRL